MQSRRAILILLVIVVGLFALATFARPRVPQAPLVDSDNMGFSRTYELGATVDDSLFIVAEEVVLREGSRVTGNAAFVSGNVTVEGQIDGDLTVTGELVDLRPTSRIGGDVMLLAERARIGGVVNGDITFSGEEVVLTPDAQLNGKLALCSGAILEQRPGVETVTAPCADFDMVRLVESLPVSLMADSLGLDPGTRLAFALIQTVFVACLLSAISTLAVALFPAQLGAMGRAIRRPQSQFVTGLLTVILLGGLGVGVVVLLAAVPALAIVLVPAALVVIVIFLVLVLAGTIPIALWLGDWLLRRMSAAQWPPLVAATLGSLVLALVVAVPVFVPFGALFSLAVAALIAMVAVGAALSTRLGTRGRQTSVFVQG